MDKTWAEFWWTSITGAQALVSEVVTSLLDRHMVVLQVPSDLPWRHQMRSCILDLCRKQSSDFAAITPVVIDAVDDNPEGLDPGRLVLNRLCPPDRNTYRERARITIQDYLVQNELLKHAVVWVKGVAGEAADQWLKFLRGFHNESPLFVLECHGNSHISVSKAIHRICYQEYITSYDLQLFNSFCIDSLTATNSDAWKRYIATAAALVCESDAEVSECLLRVINFHEEEIPDGLKSIADMPEFSRRGADMDSTHVLSLIRQQKTEEITHRIWSAQVQVFYPIIEIERVAIVQQLYDTLQTSLERNQIFQFGTCITDLMDLELGTLCYMMSNREKDSSDYILYIPNEKLRDRIRFLRECRNLLAHAHCCTPQQIGELLDRKGI